MELNNYKDANVIIAEYVITKLLQDIKNVEEKVYQNQHDPILKDGLRGSVINRIHDNLSELLIQFNK